jgi:quinol monooxygenase YgiN
MSEPIVFITHFKVKEGKLEALKQFAEAMTEHIKAEKPGTVAFIQYLNEEETEQTVIHVFPDADAFDKHVEGVAERARAGFEFIEPISREIYGMPSEKVLATMQLRPPGAPNVEFHHKPKRMGGYIRFKAE